MNERARALLDAVSDRSSAKRKGRELDAGGPSLKAAVVRLARERGVDLPDDAASWPGKKLLRRALDRSASSQRLGNPIALDEHFTCATCGREVPPHGRSARDHCPFCLWGLHVDDEVPGDRASSCGGRLEPIGVQQKKGRWMLGYRCVKCGARRVNQVLRDGNPPDDWKKVVELAARV